MTTAQIRFFTLWRREMNRFLQFEPINAIPQAVLRKNAVVP